MVYCLEVESFADSDGDGVGDFPGLIGSGEAGTGQVAVEDTGRDRVGEQRRDGGAADPVFAPAGVVGRVHDRAGGDLGLVDRRHRLGVPPQARAATPIGWPSTPTANEPGDRGAG